MEITVAASGVQSVMPVASIFTTEANILGILFVLEEPELNLFPYSQHQFVKYLSQYFTEGEIDRSLLLTTHSPYVITAFDNLILAKNVVKEKREFKEKVNDIIPEKYWLDYERVNAYYLNPKPKKGKPNAENIMNEERKGIGGNAIDEISDELNREYSKLMELRNG
jgi:ABC-type multidrug transport system ATPase subunit